MLRWPNVWDPLSEREKRENLPVRCVRKVGRGPLPSLGRKVAPQPSFIFFVLFFSFSVF
jgi:hypothetical protein